MSSDRLKLDMNDAIHEYMSIRPPDTEINRASAATKCVRARWYKKNGYKPEPLLERSYLVFAFGDMSERLITTLLMKCIGPDKFYKSIMLGERKAEFFLQNGTLPIHNYNQFEVVTEIGDLKIKGHPEGFAQLHDDTWELLEIKSAATMSYERMVREGPGDYIKQAHTLMMSDKAQELGVKSVRFFYIDKNTQHFETQLHHFDYRIWDQVEKEYKQSNSKTTPERPYEPVPETYYKKPTGKLKLPWQCSYCEFNKHCYPQAKLEIVKGKPVYYVE